MEAVTGSDLPPPPPGAGAVAISSISKKQGVKSKMAKPRQSKFAKSYRPNDEDMEIVREPENKYNVKARDRSRSPQMRKIVEPREGVKAVRISRIVRGKMPPADKHELINYGTRQM